MVRIKNIKKTPDGISGDAYVEDCPAPVRIVIDSAGEAHADPLPEGYDYCTKHLGYAIGFLRKARKTDDPPAEKLIMWY